MQHRVLLVNPNRIMPPVAPIALDYIASALDSGGFGVELLDLCFSEDPEEDIRRTVGGSEFLLIGITFRNSDDVFFPSRDFMAPRLKEVVDQIRRCSDAPIVLGGAGFSIFPENIAEYCRVPYGVWGDGELPLLALARALNDGKDVESVPGLVYRHGQGYRRNSSCFRKFDEIPPLRREWVDNKRYHDRGGMGGFETKRGCPAACVFCPEPGIKGKRPRLRHPAHVAEEIESLLSQGVDHLHTCDSEFNLPYRHAEDVCRELIRRKLGGSARWYAYLSPVPFDESLAHLMAEAGCVGINFGVDSGSDDILERLGRDFRKSDLERTASTCRKLRIPFMFDLLAGAPGETEATLTRTIELMKKLTPDRVGINAGVRLYPRLKLTDMVAREGDFDANPNVHGKRRGDDHFFNPAFYVSPGLGAEMMAAVERLVGDDRRFLFTRSDEMDDNLNYNDNSVLLDAIKNDGYRGAFWDILRRLAGD